MSKAGAGTALLLRLLLTAGGFITEWRYSTQPGSASSQWHGRQDWHAIKPQTSKIIKKKPRHPQKL